MISFEKVPQNFNRTVAAVGDTVYVIGGADRPTHEDPIEIVEALDFT